MSHANFSRRNPVWQSTDKSLQSEIADLKDAIMGLHQRLMAADRAIADLLKFKQLILDAPDDETVKQERPQVGPSYAPTSPSYSATSPSQSQTSPAFARTSPYNIR